MNEEKMQSSVSADDEIDLRDVIVTLVQGWKIIVIAMVLATLCAVIYAHRQVDTYTATTKIVTQSASQGGNAGMAGLAQMAGFNLSGGSQSVNLFDHVSVIIQNTFFTTNLLEKEWVISRILTKKEARDGVVPLYDTLTLAEFWEVPLPDTTKHDWEYRYNVGLRSRLRSLKEEYLVVTEPKSGSTVIEVQTKFANPDLAYQVNLYIMHLLKDYFEEDYVNRGVDNREFIESRLAEIEQALKASENRYTRYLEKNYATQSPKIILAGERLQREVLLQAELYREFVKQLELAKIEEKKAPLIFEVIQEAERPLYPSNSARLKLIIIGVLLGGFLGVFLVIVKKWLSSFPELKRFGIQ